MINSEDVYFLTYLGQRELAEAGTSLSRPELELLVLIDGASTVSQLQASAANRAPDELIELLDKLLRSEHIALQEIDLGDFFGNGAPREPGGKMPSESAIASGVSTLREEGYTVRIVRRPPTELRLAQGRKCVVMVVEDEQQLAANMKIVLERTGFVARVAMNREQIVAALRQQPLPDLVLLDVTLPDADGFNVLDRMRQHPLLKEIPVVMVTGTATREAVLKGLQGGADGYITKPFQIDVLIKAVKTVFGMEDGAKRPVPVRVPGPAETVGADKADVPALTPAAKPVAPAEQSVPEAGSRLAKFKQLALAKQADEKKPDSPQELIARVSGAVEKAYRYLKEFTEHLYLVKPAYAKEYSIVGVPKFEGLIWESSRIDFRTREISPASKVYEQFALHYRLSAGKLLRASRESPAEEKLIRLLRETKIDFTAQEERNERGSVVRTTFTIPCEVKASLQLLGNFDTGKLTLKMRNVEHFGTLERVFSPEAITEKSLDELAGYIIGESSSHGLMLLKGS
ncbi:MAG: response regulator [Burkholderiales bacterium]|nr:response regulator [Burkholderiales bacterium]